MNYLKPGLTIALGLSFLSFGPPNCNLFEGDCKDACLFAEKAITYPQGSWKSQTLFDRSINACETFAYSYYEKAVPYAKRGSMDEWIVLINKAVELNPVEYLGQRAWYHFFFTHNYEKSIEDIAALQALYKTGDIGETGDGLYHLNIMKALCLKGMGETQKAIQCMEDQLAKSDHYLGMYDYLHLGVLYLESGQEQKALMNLNKQQEHYNISEVHFYMAKTLKRIQKESTEAKIHLEKALSLYRAHEKMHNPYRQLVDEIYEQDIVDAL